VRVLSHKRNELNVLAPLIVSAGIEAELFVNLTVPKVWPAPVKKTLPPDSTMSELAPENVRLVLLKAKLLLQAMVEVPSVMDRVAEPVDEKKVHVKFQLLVINAPSVTVNPAQVKLLPRVVVDAPVVFITTPPEASETPFVVTKELLVGASTRSPVLV